MNTSHRRWTRKLAASALCALVVAASHAADTPPSAPGSLKLEPTGAVQSRLAYMPIQVTLSATRPEGVTKEPAYRAAPKYGVIRVGNGPKSTYVLALDEPTDADSKIYFDANRNGDLTDDGAGAWTKKTDNNGRVMYGGNSYTARASWGTPDGEQSSGAYGLVFYRFVGQDYLLMYRQAARVGTVSLDGKVHKAVLVENDADAVYAKPVELDNEGRLEGKVETRPVWLLLDLNDDGKMTTFDIRAPFTIGKTNYEAKVSADGSKLELSQTPRVAMARPKARPPLLKAGVEAPDFKADKWGGGDLKLSDYRGKVVVLDFWATWCGPCLQSMPHLEQVYQTIKKQNVVVVGLCVLDEKASYQAWVPTNKDKYSFTMAYDPAGRDSQSGIATKLYNVSGIPTTYIIDRDGKVVDAIVGYANNDTRIEAALKKVGVQAAATSAK